MLNDPAAPAAVIDPRAVSRLHPYVEVAIENQPNPELTRDALSVYGLHITVTRDSEPTVVASVFDPWGNLHPILSVLACRVGLHAVDGHLLYLEDPLLDI